jgi:hypothetical protein
VTRRAARRAALLAVLLPLAGCNAVGGIVGGVSGALTGAATTNPAVGYAVGVSVKAVTDATIQYVMRNIQRGEQDSIVRVAGGLTPGQVAPWKAEHSLPFGYGDAEGTVQVVRLIDTPLARCREVAIGIGKGEDAATIIATSCEQERGWKWANAEPAVERWGALQ